MADASPREINQREGCENRIFTPGDPFGGKNTLSHYLKNEQYKDHAKHSVYRVESRGGRDEGTPGRSESCFLKRRELIGLIKKISSAAYKSQDASENNNNLESFCKCGFIGD